MSRRARQPRQKAKTVPTALRGRWVARTFMVAVLGSFIGLLVGGYQFLSQPDRLPLRVIEINGEFRHLDRDAIQQVVTEAVDGGFFAVDMNRLREAVLAMAWVDEVSIRRSWPDRLSMMVTEQVPLARWRKRELINVRGGVFEPSSVEPFVQLMRLSGPEGSERRVVDFYRRIADDMRERGMKLSAIELDQRRHWWLRFEGDLTVSLGREQVDRRLAQFLRVYPTLAARPERRPQRVDMRYAHGFAVRWHTDPSKVGGSQGALIEDQA